MPTTKNNDNDLSKTPPPNGSASGSSDFPSKHESERPDNHDISCDKYSDFPFVQSMMATEARRTLALANDGAKQMKYPKSNSGFFQTLFVLEGRALDRIFLPWTVVTVWAGLWAAVFETYFRQHVLPVGERNGREDYIESILQIVMNTTLGFLLIFRLNRSATRFWVARGNWGIVIAKSRTMIGTILLHGSHDPYNRDQAIKWIAAFSIASMNYTRGITEGIDPETVEGVLTRDELDGVNSAVHPPLHAADRVRYHMGELFAPTEWDDTKGNSSEDDTKTASFRNARFMAVSDFRSSLLVSLEEQLNVLIDEEGAMERIKGTPLPIVYVTHLRTWLMLYLLSVPYFWEESLGFATIPIVALLAFALLGLEGAAAEVEAPFRKDRTNHLDMNSYCLTVLSNVLQQIRDDADRRIHLRNKKK